MKKELIRLVHQVLNYPVVVVYEDENNISYFIAQDVTPPINSSVESVEYLKITGIDITTFLNSNNLVFNDNNSTIANALQSFIDKSPVETRKYSVHFKWVHFC